MSWISLLDAVRALRYLIENTSISGPVNLTAPGPVWNLEFTEALASALGRRARIPAPAWGLKLVLGRMADEMLLSSQQVLPQVLLGSGFQFEHPRLKQALTWALEKREA